MATSKKDPPSRDRAARMSPNLRRSSSIESSSAAGYGPRRARSVPSSPDRKFGSSAAAPAAISGSPDVYRPSLSAAGRSASSRSISGSSRTQPFPKPTLARVKSEKATTAAAASPRPPALAVPASNSLKDMARTAASASSKAPSTLQKSKLSPRPSPDKAAASLKPITQRSPASGTARGGRTPVLSSSRVPGSTAAKKRAESANGGSASSKARSGAPQRAMAASATSKEGKEDEPSMQFEESESISTPSIEDHLHEQLPDPVDLKPLDMCASDSALYDQQAPSSDFPEQQSKNEVKESAVGNELHNGSQGADGIAKNITGTVKADDQSQQAEKEEVKAKVDKVWRKDEPKSNDVIEETKSKLLEERKSRVKALVGAFETVMSFKE
uniref:Calmodulin-binding domain-containing protein n=1 Tax=Oryza punctata TaxID=4537 RepID=A0A0E0KNN5_ORYPU